MTLRTLILLAATAMAGLLAGCGSSQKEDQGSSHGGSQREVGSSQQASEPTTNETSVGHCADKASTVGEVSRGEASNGKIVFVRRIAGGTDIYLIDEEGTHETRLTHTARLFEEHPVWSPDGQKLAFIQEDDVQKLSDIYVINADGTNEARLTKPPISGTNYGPTRSGTPTRLGSPVWSPDGDKIAFASSTLEDTAPRSSTASAMAVVERLSGIYPINVDGTGQCKLASTTVEDIPLFGGPVWSPDGDKIAFYDRIAINVINDDGSGRKELINDVTVPQLAWSPDGQRLAFADIGPSHLYVINDDGSGLRRLLTDPPGPGPWSWAVPTWSPDSGKIAFSCPFAAQGAAHTDLCVINADGTGLKRIASNLAPLYDPLYESTESNVAPSWGRE